MISLEQLKLALKLDDDSDDEELQRKLISAIYECSAYINTPYLDNQVVLNSVFDRPDVIQGIVLMVQADFDIDPTKRDIIRMAAERLWAPHRQNIGI